MSRVPVKRVEKLTTRKTIPRTGTGPRDSSTEVAIVSKRNSSAKDGKQVGKVVPNTENVEKISAVQQRTFQEALSKSTQQPGKKVRSVGAAKSRIAPPTITTKRGPERIVQQMKMETVVQRTPKAEYIAKNLIGIDVNKEGLARKLEISSHQIDPTHATESAGVNETVSAASTLSITSSGRQMKKTFKKRTVTSDKLAKKPNLNRHHVNRLVKEETEDVENTLKMVPPDIASSSIEKYPIKRKLQKLRLTAEPVSLLTQSIVHPAPTADEVDMEAPPEVVAEVIDAVEKGATPDAAPHQLFNSLFPETKDDRIAVGSVAPGPVKDIVVPVAAPPRLTDEALSQEMESFITLELTKNEQLPQTDFCTEKTVNATTRTPKDEKKIPDLLEGENPPWEDATLNKVCHLVGGSPLDFLEPSDISEMESPEDLSQELSKGIEFFLDADVVPYETKIQIRGSKLPKWFPGYMGAFSHIPDLVKVSRTPSDILHTAWKAVQPKIFPEDSILIV